jgi:hypothetical protein
MAKYLLTLLALSVFLFHASAQTSADAPSLISLPISLKYSEINNFVEKQMKGVLYLDTSYTDNNNDNMTIRVIKNGTINMVGLTNGGQIEMPLRIWFSKKIGAIYLNTDFDVTLLLVSNIAVGPSWNIISKTTLRSYKITRNPVLKVAGTGLDIKYIVQFSLDRSLPDILKDVDKSFAQNDMLRKQATEAWRTVQDPVTIDTTYHSWVRVVPLALYMEPLKYYRDELDINAAIEAHIYTGIGKPRPMANQPLKDVVMRDKLDDKFHISVKIELPYADMSDMATKMFADTTFSFSRKINFKVTGVQISGNDTSVTTSLQTQGSINSAVTLTGAPAYCDSTQEFYLRDFDYTLESGQTLLRVADRLFREKMRRSFDKAMHYSLRDQMALARKTITAFLSDYKMYNKVMISGSLADMKLAAVHSDSTMVSTIFELRGQARVRLISLTD